MSDKPRWGIAELNDLQARADRIRAGEAVEPVFDRQAIAEAKPQEDLTEWMIVVREQVNNLTMVVDQLVALVPDEAMRDVLAEFTQRNRDLNDFWHRGIDEEDQN